MYEILAHSQVTLNRQNVAAEGSANNMRLLEATGVGALLLTESRKNLNDLFAPAGRLSHTRWPTISSRRFGATFRTTSTLPNRCSWSGANHSEHTYKQRMEELVGLLRAHARG